MTTQLVPKPQESPQLPEQLVPIISAIASSKLAKVMRDRNVVLRREGAYTQQQLDQAQTALETAEAVVKARQASVNAAIKQVNTAVGALPGFLTRL